MSLYMPWLNASTATCRAKENIGYGHVFDTSTACEFVTLDLGSGPPSIARDKHCYVDLEWTLVLVTSTLCDMCNSRRSLWARHVYSTWSTPLNLIPIRFLFSHSTKKEIPKLSTPSHKSRSLGRLMYYHVSHPASSCNGPADLSSAPIQTLQWDPSPRSRRSREPEHGLEIGKTDDSHYLHLDKVPKLFMGWVRVREIEVCGGRQRASGNKVKWWNHVPE